MTIRAVLPKRYFASFNLHPRVRKFSSVPLSLFLAHTHRLFSHSGAAFSFFISVFHQFSFHLLGYIFLSVPRHPSSSSVVLSLCICVTFFFLSCNLLFFTPSAILSCLRFVLADSPGYFLQSVVSSTLGLTFFPGEMCVRTPSQAIRILPQIEWAAHSCTFYPLTKR